MLLKLVSYLKLIKEKFLVILSICSIFLLVQSFNACRMNYDHNPVSPGGGNQVSGEGVSKGPFYNPEIYNLFKKNCSSCHNSNSSIPNWLDYNVAYLKRNLIFSRVVTKKDMPMGQSMADRDRELIAAWIEAGAPLQPPNGTVADLPPGGDSPPTDPPVNGGWSAWEESQSCNRSCGGGVRIEVRYCNSPAPQNGGAICTGPSEQSIPCNEQVCIGIPVPVNGVWSSWEPVGSCSKTCGLGLQTLKRSCNNPSPVNGGLNCIGEKTSQVECNLGPCTGEVGYNELIQPLFQNKCSACHNENSAIPNWLQYEVAFAMKDSIRNRVYVVRNMPLVGSMTEDQRKLVADWVDSGAKQTQPPIPIHGGWTEFVNSGACDKDCGGGQQLQTRTCSNPMPANGGQDCAGLASRSVYCAMIPCNEGDPVPVPGIDGGWSNWQDTTSCSKTCGSGSKTQSRTCTEPAPSNGGKECAGPSTRQIECNTQPCPVDGGWGNWIDVGSCSLTCGGGQQQQRRACDSPAPANGGALCDGENTRSLSCNEHVCPELIVAKIECSNSFNRIYIDARFSPTAGVTWFGANTGWGWIDLPFLNGQSTMQGGGFIISCPATVQLTTNRGGWVEFPVRILD